MSEKELELEEISEIEKSNIAACTALATLYAGQINQVSDGFARSFLKIANEHLCDTQGLAHTGFIYSAASYIAQVVLKRTNTFPIQSRTHYLAPVKVGDVVVFEASCKLENTKRPEVIVKGFVRDICVFDGLFYVLATEEHVLKMQKDELRRYQAKK